MQFRTRRTLVDFLKMQFRTRKVEYQQVRIYVVVTVVRRNLRCNYVTMHNQRAEAYANR